LSQGKPQARGPGRVLLFTGDGKGKTTAAFGLGLRAAGHGMTVCAVQFIKERTDVGEVKAARQLGERFEVHPTGCGFVRTQGGTPEDRAAAARAMDLARRKVDECDVLILDEVCGAVDLGLLDVSEVTGLLASRPPGVHLVLTGRRAPAELVQIADTVTEMRNVKHAYDSGADAAPGVEF